MSALTAAKQQIDLATITLQSGSHDSPESGACMLEVVSMMAGEPFGDSPECVCPVLAAFGRSWNDGLRSDEDREQLKQYIPRLLNTRSSKAVEERRAMMAADWLIRGFTPAWLDLTPSLQLHATALRAHPEITDTVGLISVLPITVAAQKDAAAAGATARAAAWAAAGAAAGDAAWDAAWAAAGDAAWDALAPTVTRLQASAHVLYDRMIREAECRCIL